MSSIIFGDQKKLSPSEKHQLSKLQELRVKGDGIVDQQLVKKVSHAVTRISLPIGLLVNREGRIEFIALGTKQRLYLPDLGRVRLDELKLRKLRLLVFWPEDNLNWCTRLGVPLENNSSLTRPKERFPVISRDFITDLEKLRLDCVLLVPASTKDNVSCSLASYKVSRNNIGSADLKVGLDYYQSVLDLDFDFKEHIEELEKVKNSIISSTKKVREKLAILVGVYTSNSIDNEYSMDELKELARTADLVVADSFVQKRRSLDPRTVIGRGKIEELVLHALDLGADLLVFDCELTPSQLREITKITELRIIDRSMLILDIFAQRAKSSEGKLQVELAQLKYNLPRLTDKDSGLSRLTGGVGGRGPGETKLEISRRRARDRIVYLESRIDTVAKQRELRRSRRFDRGVPVVGIVGYTNAGKSTLLNSISKSDTFAEDKLFATLETSSRRMRFPNEKEIVFVDTVGFIRNLPKELMGAFRATLEEIIEADVLLHVVDSAGPEVRRHIEVVEKTLADLKYDDKPKVLVLNKCDLLSEPEKSSLTSILNAMAVSAKTREGIPDLVKVLAELINDERLMSGQGKDPGAFLEYPGTDS